MSASKRDFVAIADALQWELDHASDDVAIRETVTRLMVTLANHFDKTSPTFNRQKFLNACYHGEYEINE